MKIKTLDILTCGYCKDHEEIDKLNHGRCKKDGSIVFPGNTHCVAVGELTPGIWYGKEPHLSNYLELEKKHGVRLLAKNYKRN